MFLAIRAIVEYLRAVPHFQSWDVRDNLDLEARGNLPALDLRLEGASVADPSPAQVRVQPAITLTIVVPRGPRAAQQLDDAFTQAIAALQGYAVRANGQCWSRLQLAAVRDAPPQDNLAGCELIFTHFHTYPGAACAC